MGQTWDTKDRKWDRRNGNLLDLNDHRRLRFHKQNHETLVRQPRDLEDLIDIFEYVQRPAVGSTGGRMNLINDSDRHMARMMCVMALKSSDPEHESTGPFSDDGG
ncbi:hypothetical protein [Streptomyces sp. NPDC059455]|uniref:hypothetical protein n=1 Tax=Streptomyces sp. NPDC059455 TaxID=3346837 RepID=UPI0036C021D5